MFINQKPYTGKFGHSPPLVIPVVFEIYFEPIFIHINQIQAKKLAPTAGQAFYLVYLVKYTPTFTKITTQIYFVIIIL